MRGPFLWLVLGVLLATAIVIVLDGCARVADGGAFSMKMPSGLRNAWIELDARYLVS